MGKIGTKKLETTSYYMAYRCLLILIWGQFFIFQYFRAVIMRIPLVSFISDMVVPCLFIICSIMALPHILSKSETKDILIPLCFALVFMCNWIFYPENASYLQAKTANIFLVIIPLYYVGLSFDAEKELDLLYYVSVINIMLQIIYVVLFKESMNEIQSLYEGNMDIAYKALPHVSLTVAYAFKKSGICRIAAAVASFVYLVSCGSRGPVVILLIFIVLYILVVRKYRYKRISYIFMGIAGISICIFYDKIFLLLANISAKMGMSVRIFDKLAGNVFWQSSGRSDILESLFYAIEKKPLIGYGMGGDYGLLNTYSHNLAVELWVSYGIIIGTALLLLAVAVLWKGINAAAGTNEKIITSVLICSCFFKLFFSGTYLNETYIMFLFGICVAAMRRSKTEKENCIISVKKGT